MIGFLKFELYGLSVYLCRSIRPETCERALAATAKASWRGDWNQRSQKGAMNGRGSCQ